MLAIARCSETDVRGFPCPQLAQPRTRGAALTQPRARKIAPSTSVSITSLTAMILLMLEVKQVHKCHAESRGKDFSALSWSQFS